MGSLCSEPRDRPAAPRGLASNPVRSSGHMASLSSVGVQLHCRWPSRRAAPGPRCGTASGRAQGARRAQRRQNKGAESARAQGGIAGLARRGSDQRGTERRAGGQRHHPGPPLKAPFLPARARAAPGTPGRGRSSPSPPGRPVAPSLRRCRPNPRCTQSAARGKRTPPTGRGRGRGRRTPPRPP